MASDPRVRARHMKSLLAGIDRLDRVDGDAVRAHIAPATRGEVEQATGVEWLPAALNLEVTHAIYTGLGEAGGARFFRETLRVAFSGPLLRTVIEAAERVFHVDAASFVGWVGSGWTLVFRDCGRWRIDRAGDRGAALVIEALPEGFAGDEVWLRSLAHSLEAFFDVARAKGSVSFEGCETRTGRARYRIAWN